VPGPAIALADPLCVFEPGLAVRSHWRGGGAPRWDRSPPPWSTPTAAGDRARDWWLDDTRRFAGQKTWLAERKVTHELRYYPRGIHAAHALASEPAARTGQGDALAVDDRDDRDDRTDRHGGMAHRTP
jgi:hypothetical protein